MRLEGKTAIVTGAGRNIGRAIAERFAAEGAAVLVVDLDGGAAQAVADGIRSAGGRAAPFVADVSDEAAVSAMVNECEASLGGVDILVNNVAKTVNKTILDTSVEEWEACLRISLRSAFLCTKAAAQSMMRRGGGSIVNVSSTSGYRGATAKFAYAVAKAGILNLTRAAAVDLAPYKIRVNTLTPTQTGSPVGLPDDTPDRGRQPSGIPMERFGLPSEQAAAALFLASDEASFVTGEDLVVDGGLLAVFPRAM
jgi:NAD(P)-dependent dehydrogenase (short-subunit alcohol dehydrogenase family)